MVFLIAYHQKDALHASFSVKIDDLFRFGNKDGVVSTVSSRVECLDWKYWYFIIFKFHLRLLFSLMTSKITVVCHYWQSASILNL